MRSLGSEGSQDSESERPAISLVIPTVGKRPLELERLLESLSEQTFTSFEIVVVDQSEGQGVIRTLEQSALSQRITHLRRPPGLSAARNQGWREGSGDLVAFPDDDCWYHPRLLEEVVAVFSREPEWAGVCAVTRDRSGALSLARFAQEESFVGLKKVWRQGVEPAMFFRTDLLRGLGGFDESFGIGGSTPFKAGEGTELLIRAVRAGYRVRFMPQIQVGHDQAPIDGTAAGRERALGYGRGIGRVLRVSSLPAGVALATITRPLMGVVVAVAGGQWHVARFRWFAFRGRLEGWLARDPR